MKKAMLVTFFTLFLAAQGYSQAIERLSAQFLRFDVSETSCQAASATCPAAVAGGTGGRLVYSHPVFVPLLSGSPVLSSVLPPKLIRMEVAPSSSAATSTERCCAMPVPEVPVAPPPVA